MTPTPRSVSGPMFHSFAVRDVPTAPNLKVIFNQTSTFTGLAYCYVSAFDSKNNPESTVGYLGNATQGSDVIAPQILPDAPSSRSFVEVEDEDVKTTYLAWCNELNGQLTQDAATSAWVLQGDAGTLTLNTSSASASSPAPAGASPNGTNGVFSQTAPPQLTPFFKQPVIQPPTQTPQAGKSGGSRSSSKANLAALTITALTLGFFYTLTA